MEKQTQKPLLEEQPGPWLPVPDQFSKEIGRSRTSRLYLMSSLYILFSILSAPTLILEAF
jgi:hypothetical protein